VLLLKRLSFAAVVLAFAQIVFGAVVRITGSGMGCGDHWPKCNGAWFPPHDRLDLIIEITHRYLAFGLSVVILALVLTAWRRRSEPGVGGSGGILRPSIVAGALVVAAALLGAVTVKLLLNPLVIAAHLTIAMTLLAALALAHFRAGGFGAASDFSGASPRSWRSARGAVVLSLTVLVLGAFTANLPDAASSCAGFPHCRSINASGTPLTVHIIHRIAAFLLLGHLIGMFIAVRKRREPTLIRRAAGTALTAAVIQVIVAALMIEMHFPAVLRSLHQAVGTFVWLAIVITAIVTARASRSAPARELMGAPA
jgi:heme A synthase